jgi:cytidylate kinase
MGGHQHRPVVTLAALYGTGALVVASRLAERLDVPLLDREISQAVASQLGLYSEVAELDDHPRRGFGRMAGSLGRLSTVIGEGGGSFERLDLQDREVRGHIEELLARCRTSGGVVIARGGAVVLDSLPWVLHARLRGPRQARVRQAATQAGIDLATAAQRQRAEDRGRRRYAREVYGLDEDDLSRYHVVLDSTALSPDVCVDILAEAATSRVRDHDESSRAEQLDEL